MYYYYLRPDLPVGHKERFNKFGYVSERAAIDAAVQLNQVFGHGGDLAAQVIRKAEGDKDQSAVGDYIDEFTTRVLPSRLINGHPMSQHTLEEYDRLYRNIKKADLGKLPLRAVTLADISDFLADIGSTAEVHNKYRTRLIDLFRHAVAEGKMEENLAEKTIPRDKELKKRKRITLPGDKPGVVGIDGIAAYKAIFEKADFPIRCAMELSLNALQRREEIHRWRFDWSRDDQDGRHVYIRISKTHKHGVASYVRIPEALPVVHSEFGANTLGDLIRHCRSDKRVSPHLIHRKPVRVKKAKGREHPFQLTSDQITKGFSKARDSAGIYDHLPTEQKPTFHELLGLGEHLRKRQGWTDGQIQRLRGHSKESTTKLYLEGHEWTTVEMPLKNLEL